MRYVADKIELTQNFIRSILHRLQRAVTIASQKALMVQI